MKLRKKRLHLGLKLSNQQNAAPGCQLATKLIDVQPSMSGAVSERGIVGLLNLPSAMSGLSNIQFERDKDTSLLSPAKSQRLGYFPCFQTLFQRKSVYFCFIH